jgi:rhamnosyltransferase
MLTSIIIRTYNEARYLDELLTAIGKQKCRLTDVETILVDSGSTDATLAIAQKHGARITHIRKEDFTFGRSLNMGCEAAQGEILAFISGHCIPVDGNWIDELVKPLINGVAGYSYGRQIGRDSTKFSESCLFSKYFPAYSKLPQDGFFCNNANAAILRSAWSRFRFHEGLTGLEDMYLAQQLVQAGERIAYTADAAVFHIHNERWEQVKIRYEREAIALRQIMPNVHFTFPDFVTFFFTGFFSDCGEAKKQKVLVKNLPQIFLFRLMHYWGTYCGNRETRKLSAQMKYHYFYPGDLDRQKYEP